MEVGSGAVEVRVTPCAGSGQVKRRRKAVDKMATYHRETLLYGGSDRLGQVVTGTTGLEANGHPIDEVLVLAQALGVIGVA